MTKVMNKKLKRIKEHPSQENQEQVKEFKNQEEFKTQEESLQTRIKIQDLKNRDQDSRIKKRLNQDKY